MPALDEEVSLARVLNAIRAIKAGQPVIMTDDEDRENEGDLVVAAELCQAEQVNFMAKEGRGLICLAMDRPLIEKLHLPMMEDLNKYSTTRATAFTVSIEAREGVTTGISAKDRARTISVAISDQVQPTDLVVPGHIFPLKARPGGVLERAGHTEGSVDLARLAGLKAAAVICEIMNDDGTMARRPDLDLFAQKHELAMVTIADLITFRLMRDSLVEPVCESVFQIGETPVRAVVFRSLVDRSEHLALVKGSDFGDEIVDVRVHMQRPLMDVFGPITQVHLDKIGYGMDLLKRSERAVFLYFSRSGSMERIHAELAALSKSEVVHAEAAPESQMDWRQIGTGAQIIRWFGVKKMRVHTVAERTWRGLNGFGLEVADTKIIDPPPGEPSQ